MIAWAPTTAHYGTQSPIHPTEPEPNCAADTRFFDGLLKFS
jgi:hypothetical protein